jgi:hypothetical protein
MNASTCINHICGKTVYARGLCFACYTAARARVVSKQTTWKALEKANRALPSRSSGKRAPTSQRGKWLLGTK